MSELVMIRQAGGGFLPATDDDAESIRRIKPGAAVRVEVKQIRNYKFLRKWFSLVEYAFDIWSETVPMLKYKGSRVQPNFERFRKDLTILAGHYVPVFNARGEVRLEAKSISFANMSDEEFESLYSATIDAILNNILHSSGMTEDQLRDHVDNVLRYS